MLEILFNVFLTLLLVGLNGFFVAAEFAIVKVRSSQVELMIRNGSKIAKVTKHLIEHLDSYLSATQLGITLASLGLGWIGESVVSMIIIAIMDSAGIDISAELAHSIALPIAFMTITILHIVFGELAPKSLAIQRSETVSLAISLPLRLFYIVFKPVIVTLNSFANWILKLIGIEAVSEIHAQHSSEELRLLLEEGSRSGAIKGYEHVLLDNVFEFTEIPVKQIMVPRGHIVAMEISTPSNKLPDMFIDVGYSRLPVYEKSIDNIVGVIYAKDIIAMMQHSTIILINDIIRPIYFVQEDEKIYKLLSDMQRKHFHVAVVLDEFGGTAGLITLEDIIEEIVGDIQDEYDEETPIIEQINDTEFIIKASAVINDANDYLPQPLPSSDDYESVAGLIIGEIGRIPEKDEVIDIPNYQCRIIKRSKRNIEIVKLIWIPKQEEE